MKRLVTAPLAGGAAAVDVRLLQPQAYVPSAGTRRIDWPDLAARMLIVALFTLMVMNIASDYLHTARVTGLLLLVNEAVVVVLTVFRRPTAIVDKSLRARVVTTASVMGPPLVRPAAVAALAPGIVTVLVSIAGLAIVLAGKLTLGRSFGLMPANRGVVCRGIYRLVRHPIYMGYLITHAGFLAANPTMWNVVTLVSADFMLLVRAVCEERTLAQDPAYAEYLQRVRWRVLPGVF